MIEQHTTLLEANVSPSAMLLAANYLGWGSTSRGSVSEREIISWLGVVRTHIEDREHDALKARKKAA